MPSDYSSTPVSNDSPEDMPGGFGLYVHWPFCESKCPYCDFNSHVRETIAHERWAAAFAAEIAYFRDLAGPRRLKSIFFGGGTPSLMRPETVEAVIAAARAAWPFDNAIEITMEANPTSVEADRFRAYADAGVNRLSLGVQALNDADLGFLGRRHTAAEAVSASKIAAANFARHSFDLIYARPGQTVADWKDELAQAIDLSGGHISLYQLTIEPGTAFHGAYKRGAFTLPDEETAAQLFETTQEMLDAAGMSAYEISNHASPDAESVHNLIYWRSGEWVGVGPGAHGRVHTASGRTAFRQTRTPEAWLQRVERDGQSIADRGALPPEDIAAEFLMMGLRLVEGVDRRAFKRLVGEDVVAHVDPAGLARLQEGGFVELDDTALRATAAGRQRLNAVLAALAL